MSVMRAFALLLVPGIAQAAPAISPHDRIAALLAMPVASELTGAAHAPRIAWVENRFGARAVMISDGGAAPRRLTVPTGDDGTQLWDLALSEDGAQLAYVRGGDGEFADSNAPDPDGAPSPVPPVVHVIGADGGDRALGEGHAPAFSPDGASIAFARGGTLLAGPVAAARPVLTTAGSIAALHWSPDGRRIVLELDRGDHGLLGVWEIGGARLRFLDPSLGVDSDPAISPDGRSIAWVRSIEPPPGAALRGHADAKARYWSIHLADLATGEARVLWRAPAGIGAVYDPPGAPGLAWTSDGRLLFPWEGGGWQRICALATDRPDPAPACLTPERAETTAYRVTGDRRLIYLANPDDPERWRVWSMPLSGGTPAPLTPADAEAAHLVAAGSDVAVIETSARRTAHPVLLGQDGSHAAPDPGLPAGIGFVAPQDVRFSAADGVALHGQLFVPPAGVARHPALVFVHGGPMRQMLPAFSAMGYYSNAYLMNQTLASLGYVVLSVNYRSGTGYGAAFRRAPGIARDGAAEYRDVRAAAALLAARGDVDPRRIGIWGGSWGGYLTALALARDSDIFRAGVDFHGVHDLTRNDRPGLSPQDNAELHRLEWSSSPMADLDRWRSPVLLIHGDDDHNVSFAQSVMLARALAARGVPYEDHVLPGERHGFLRAADWLDAYLRMVAFFGETLSPG